MKLLPLLIAALISGPFLGLRCPSQPRSVDEHTRRLNAVRAGVDTLAECGMEPYATQARAYLPGVTFDPNLQRQRYDAVALHYPKKRVVFNPQTVDNYPPRYLGDIWLDEVLHLEHGMGEDHAPYRALRERYYLAWELRHGRSYRSVGPEDERWRYGIENGPWWAFPRCAPMTKEQAKMSGGRN